MVVKGEIVIEIMVIEVMVTLLVHVDIQWLVGCAANLDIYL